MRQKNGAWMGHPAFVAGRERKCRSFDFAQDDRLFVKDDISPLRMTVH
jgi:hypothetical protein